VAADLGLGTASGSTGVEIRGAQENAATHGGAWRVVAGVALGVGALVVRACCGRR
jgi:hypothetical protein